METIIKADNICKAYGAKYALDKFSIDIEANNIIGLIGKNGSGKTTFMKNAAGIIIQTTGDISLFDENPYNNLKVQKRLIYSYHDIPFPGHVTLRKLLWQYTLLFDNFDYEFAVRMMKYFTLNENNKYFALSQGMKSTFNFICAIASRSEITMLDEPVLGMDVTVRKAVYDILMRDYMEHPRSFIISSHILNELEGILSQIILVEKGKLVLYKDIDEVRQMAFRIDGSKQQITDFLLQNSAIYSRRGELNNYAIFTGSTNCELAQIAKAAGLNISSVKAEDLCVYLTENRKENDFECLWQN